MTLSRQAVTAAGVAAAALAAVVLALANFVAEGENGGIGPYLGTLAVSVAIAAVLFGWAIPRSERPGRAGLIAAGFALLSLPVFWTGLPYVLGPAAIVYGLAARARADRTGTTAIVLGALATAAGVAAAVVDQMT
jgi:hypothetical protein